MIKKAIIPAAGYGTRSLPITKVIPKEMFPIGTKPAIHYVVEEAIKSGIEHILIIVSRSKNSIIDYFDRSIELETFLSNKNKDDELIKEIPNVNIHFIRQPIAKGLGDAVLLGKTFINEDPFAILLPDEIFFNNQNPGLSQLQEVYKKFGKSVIALRTLKEDVLKNYGIVKANRLGDSIYELDDIIEKPKDNPPSNLGVIGRYILTPEIFYYLEHLTPGVGNEIQLTDAIKQMIQQDRVLGSEISGERYDIGSLDEYIDLLQRFKTNN